MDETTARKLQKSLDFMRLKVIDHKGEAVKGLTPILKEKPKKVKPSKIREVQ